jgi:predicted metal-dependent hydrolase
VDSWADFIHTHHYELHNDFFESWIANHPRRTGEAYWNQYMEAAFIDNNPVSRTKSLSELRQWYEPLIAAERSAV